ncbi:hypothetical protein D3C87_1813960 [compost metagenome]
MQYRVVLNARGNGMFQAKCLDARTDSSIIGLGTARGKEYLSRRCIQDSRDILPGPLDG